MRSPPLWRFALFALIAIAVLCLGVGYVGARLTDPLSPGSPLRSIVWGALVAWAVLTPVVFALRRSVVGGERWFTVIEWIAYLALGLFAMLFSFTIIKDLGWVVLRALDAAVGLLRGGEGLVDPERRRLLSLGLNGAAVGVSGLAVISGYREARRTPDVVEVDVPIAGLPPALDGLRIVQITDLHVGPTIRGDWVRAVVERANTLDADLVAVTGDLVDGSVAELWEHVAPLGELKARHGVFFVTGNHEYYSGAEQWMAAVERLGWTVLTNAHRLIEHGEGRLLVAGVTDFNAGQILRHHASDPAAAVRGAPDAHALLAHQPRSASDAAPHGFDLQLSGHTHGGQFFPWNLMVGLQQPFLAGLDRLGTMWVYTSRGTGYWGPPLRLAAPSEITLLRLRPAASEA